jgi:hypothetical protein
MSTSNIRSLINEAIDHEGNTHHLKKCIEEHLLDMHTSIHIDSDQSIQKMVDFVIEYTTQVPDFIDALEMAAAETGLSEAINPLLNIATDYFTTPPDLIGNHIGLDAMMDEAYLAHRLIEEINDQFISHMGVPLIPMDLTTANVIIHNMIGEPFANDLDKIAHQSVLELLGGNDIFKEDAFKKYSQKHNSSNTPSILKNWPCFSKNMGVSLALSA